MTINIDLPNRLVASDACVNTEIVVVIFRDIS